VRGASGSLPVVAPEASIGMCYEFLSTIKRWCLGRQRDAIEAIARRAGFKLSAPTNRFARDLIV
jgi:hypothetical protein